MSNLSAVLLELRRQRDDLNRAIEALEGLTGTSSTPRRIGRGGRRRLSPEARARIVAAQKKRWAKFRKGKKK